MKLIKRFFFSGYVALARLESRFDRVFLLKDVPAPPEIDHVGLLNSLKPTHGGKLRVLEVGSREVTGPSNARERFAPAEYVGFDYYPGRNVDVVGDVHQLSSYFKPGEKFDLIYSTACFEHFAMPWLVATEIAKLLNVGGILAIATHFSFAAHERPWNFFQFSDMGLRVLFSEALGFECIGAGLSNPMVGRYSGLAPKALRYQPIVGLYAGSVFIGRKVRDETAFDWNRVSVQEVVSGTTYPQPKAPIQD